MLKTELANKYSPVLFLLVFVCLFVSSSFLKSLVSQTHSLNPKISVFFIVVLTMSIIKKYDPIILTANVQSFFAQVCLNATMNVRSFYKKAIIQAKLQ